MSAKADRTRKSSENNGLAGEAYVIVRERILRGELAIGQVISRRKVAAELGMSFLPVSEALLRLEHEGLLEEMQVRLDLTPDMMRILRQTVEHPFGTIKAWMGATHFLTRTIERVSTEISLHVLAYNMKRVIKLIGSETVMKAMQA